MESVESSQEQRPRVTHMYRMYDSRAMQEQLPRTLTWISGRTTQEIKSSNYRGYCCHQTTQAARILRLRSGRQHNFIIIFALTRRDSANVVAARMHRNDHLRITVKSFSLRLCESNDTHFYLILAHLIEPAVEKQLTLHHQLIGKLMGIVS